MGAVELSAMSNNPPVHIYHGKKDYAFRPTHITALLGLSYPGVIHIANWIGSDGVPVPTMAALCLFDKGLVDRVGLTRYSLTEVGVAVREKLKEMP